MKMGNDCSNDSSQEAAFSETTIGTDISARRQQPYKYPWLNHFRHHTGSRYVNSGRTTVQVVALIKRIGNDMSACRQRPT
jgi:hypothetical protein